MSEGTAIEWCNTYHDDGTVTKGSTWNPIRGQNARHTCARISPGCDNCYAATMTRRGLMGTAPLDYGTGETPNDPARLDEKALLLPLTWKKPRKVFVASMTDLFGSWVPDEWIDRAFAVMASSSRHTYIVLTKRPTRMRDYLNRLQGQLERLIAASRTLGYSLEFERTHLFDWPLPNVWLGTTIESDQYAWRADRLRQTPAAVRWVSAEPLLSGLPSLNLDGIDWLVSGGESGPKARPMHPDWARALRDRCQVVGTAFFHKQNGAYVSSADCPSNVRSVSDVVAVSRSGSVVSESTLPVSHTIGMEDWGIEYRAAPADSMFLMRVGNHRSGRLLDGREWNEFPVPAGSMP